MLAARGSRRATIERCAGMLSADGCMVETHDTKPDGGATEQAREAAATGFDTIFACGGDGTMFWLLQGFRADGVLRVRVPHDHVRIAAGRILR